MTFEFVRDRTDGVIEIRPRVFGDARGSFLERYKQSAFEAAGIREAFVQDNHSISTRGVLRGIHYQLAPRAQGKLVWVTEGRVWDVCVDLRRSSPHFGGWSGYELSSDQPRMLYVPPGFGHGFLVLSDTAHFLYKCTAEYDASLERGVRWDDPDVGIEWPLRDVIVSAKDEMLPRLAEAEVFEDPLP